MTTAYGSISLWVTAVPSFDMNEDTQLYSDNTADSGSTSAMARRRVASSVAVFIDRVERVGYSQMGEELSKIER